MIKRNLILAAAASTMLLGASSAAFAAGGPKGPPPGHGGMMMQMFDADSDGKVTRDEASAKFMELFGQADANGDKKISFDEAKAFFKEMASKMPGPPPGGPEAGSENGPENGDTPPPPRGADGEGKMGAKGDHGPRDGMKAGDRKVGPGGMKMGQREGGRRGGEPGMRGHHHGDPRMMMVMKFVKADANDDGFVSESEFGFVTDQAFTRMDRNGDGVIDARDMPRRMGMHGMNRPGMEQPMGGPDNPMDAPDAPEGGDSQD